MSGFRLTLTGVALWKETWGHVIPCFKTDSHSLGIPMSLETLLHSREWEQPTLHIKMSRWPTGTVQWWGQPDSPSCCSNCSSVQRHSQKEVPTVHRANFNCEHTWSHGALHHIFSFIQEMSQSIPPYGYKLPVSPTVFQVLKLELS